MATRLEVAKRTWSQRVQLTWRENVGLFFPFGNTYGTLICKPADLEPVTTDDMKFARSLIGYTTREEAEGMVRWGLATRGWKAQDYLSYPAILESSDQVWRAVFGRSSVKDVWNVNCECQLKEISELIAFTTIAKVCEEQGWDFVTLRDLQKGQIGSVVASNKLLTYFRLVDRQPEQFFYRGAYRYNVLWQPVEKNNTTALLFLAHQLAGNESTAI